MYLQIGKRWFKENRTPDVRKLLGFPPYYQETTSFAVESPDPLDEEQEKHERRMRNHWIRSLDAEEVPEPKPEVE